MKIRLMNIKDYSAVYRLWMSCAGMGLNTIDDTEEGINRFLERNPDTCFVAEDKNGIIGAILVGNDGRRGYIYHTAVLPGYRRQGIATQLVDTAMEALHKIGIIKVALVVFNRNETGNTFWESMGFTERDDLVYRNKVFFEIERIDT
ncbi:MAG: GNAT family N-acetyltransferase [Ruminococcus sp.]|nr:GNAT family N-acetyltransferase [Ruminococcus sp.]